MTDAHETNDAAVGAAAARRGPGRLGFGIRIVAIVAALAVLGVGITTRRDAKARERSAEAASTNAGERLTRTREQEHRARTDRAAARAAIADFTDAAHGATDASAALITEEAALTDRLARLRAAGASGDFGTYNRIVGELNASVDEINAAAANLQRPFESLSKSLTGLPTAHCAGTLATPTTFVAYGSSGLRCARLRVPLDYADPHGPTLEITAVVRPAEDPAHSLGPLFLNPGGPGGSAIAFLREASLVLPAEVLRRFDLVGVDPRGVGQSTPVDCADSLDPLFDNRLTSGTTSVRAKALRLVQRLVHQCGERSGALLRHVDTASTARDLDRVRVALHARQISYIGFSYGTYLGAVYADIFRHNLRAAVLDGAVSPNRARRTESLSDSGLGFDDALTAALFDCSAKPSCAFFSGGNPSKAYDALMASFTVKPLDVAGRAMGRGLAELGVVSALYDGHDGWTRLTDALAHAALGDGAPLLALSDDYAGRRKDGSYNNELEAHYAINCIELGSRPSPTDAQQRVRNLGTLGRFDAVSLMLSMPCAFWPVPPVNGLSDIHATGSAPILVVGNAHDPVTPIENATALAKSLDHAVLLRWEGSGHTVVGRGIDCIDTAVTNYLVNLTAPADGTSCPA